MVPYQELLLQLFHQKSDIFYLETNALGWETLSEVVSARRTAFPLPSFIAPFPLTLQLLGNKVGYVTAICLRFNSQSFPLVFASLQLFPSSLP